MCKEFIPAKEASVLLNCSEPHIHNLVDRARRQIGDYPIPFRKVGEVTTFLRTELLEWTKGRSNNQLRAAQGRIKFALPIRNVREINAAEERIRPIASSHGDLVVDLKPYQPRTFALRLTRCRG